MHFHTQAHQVFVSARHLASNQSLTVLLACTQRKQAIPRYWHTNFNQFQESKSLLLTLSCTTGCPRHACQKLVSISTQHALPSTRLEHNFCHHPEGWLALTTNICSASPNTIVKLQSRNAPASKISFGTRCFCKHQKLHQHGNPIITLPCGTYLIEYEINASMLHTTDK